MKKQEEKNRDSERLRDRKRDAEDDRGEINRMRGRENNVPMYIPEKGKKHHSYRHDKAYIYFSTLGFHYLKNIPPHKKPLT